MTRAVGPEELSDQEVESVAEAVDIFRAAPTSPSFFHTSPMKDESGRLCEVRFYKDAASQHPLGVIAIANDGALLPLQWL
jgi:hypothetical protein